jgi:aminoglycoside phosphotransferase (APT) family kinase protein
VERDSRYIKFNFEALCQRIIDLCPGADAIATCQKIEGGFNRVFIFTLDNAKQIVARLPFPLAGPTKLTTASEVATVRYLQARTSIPIPTILDWHDDAAHKDNLIGSEYIIMEHASGVPLREKWQEMTGDQQVRCIDAIYRTIKEAVDLEFPAFGSIYFNDSVDSPYRKFLDEDFCIGPHCSSRYWDCNPGEHRYYDRAKPNHGPCKLQ